MSNLVLDVDPNRPMLPVSREQLVSGLRALGLQAGDHVLAHSALSSFGHVEGGAQTVVDVLVDLIGPHGTLVMPYFYPLYEGIFDYAHPPAPYTGAVPQLLRRRAGAILSVHPSHPVVALGPAAAQITADHFQVSAVGRGSPIDRLAKMGGKVLLLGVRQSANTTLHTGEAYAGVPYWGQPRPNRPAGRQMLLPNGRQVWVPLPETPGDSAGFPRIEPFLVERGLIQFGAIGRARCRLISGQPLIDAVVEYLRQDPAGLLCEQPDCAYCTWARKFLMPRR
jgi:aminoglycoside 3-N-acetyltransferase